MSVDVTLVTCAGLPEPDPDEAPLLEALAAAGVRARMAAWDDPDVDWSASPLTVVRSTWNYATDRDAFLAWMRRVGAARTTLRNPAATMAANTHKGYLAGLERDGVPTVPTRWVPRGGATGVAEVVGSLPWRHVVVKPAVGAGSSGVRAFDLDDPEAAAAAAAHVSSLTAVGDVLVQPRLESIVREGERNVVWIDGEWTHAVTKLARLDGDHEITANASAPTDAEVAIAQRALRTLDPQARRSLLYARVDVAADELGTLRVVELELVEPSLFVALHRPALDRLVAAIARESGAAAR